MLINSQIQLGKNLTWFPEEIVKNETMLFRADYDFAFKHGGLPTKEFLRNLPKEFKNEPVLIDSRVHMLMKGWYPCIPGFHHDDVDRNTVTGQPNYYTPAYRTKHALALFNGGICSTEFAIGKSEFSEPSNAKVIYKQWHPEVVSKIGDDLHIITAPTEQVVLFDDRTWHQGTPATSKGWRFFIRATIGSGVKARNEIRNQVQVYMDDIHQGW